MPKEEWGVKRLCPTTGKRFYDLNRTPIVSPYTGEVVQIETSRRDGMTAAEARAAKKAPVPVPVRDDDDLLVDDDDTDIDVDAELLDEEGDDDGVPLDDLADVAGEDDET
jgi:uncharacterized protein (TIGR02300 family)